MDNVCRHILVSGHVQGVAFRYSAAERARALGLTGWVRNVTNGCVEAVVEGPEEQVGAMLDWMGQGPDDAQVTAVKQREHLTVDAVVFQILPTADQPEQP